jgi:hypothetical protein
MKQQYPGAMLRSTSDPPLPPLQSARLLDPLRERIRYLHCSIRTEQACIHWVRAFVRFHRMRHPREMGQLQVGGGAACSPLDALQAAPVAREPTPCHLPFRVTPSFTAAAISAS